MNKRSIILGIFVVVLGVLGYSQQDILTNFMSEPEIPTTSQKSNPQPEVLEASVPGIDIISWNIESGGSEAFHISQRIQSMESIELWGFSEVQSQGVHTILEQAIEQNEGGRNYEAILSESGGADRLLIIYDASRFEKLSHFEIEDINIGGRVRAPLVAHLRDNESGNDFYFMVNHLYRSNEQARHQQAQLLNRWSKATQIPVIAVGDYNFDYEVDGSKWDQGYGHFIADGEFIWIEPKEKIKTFCSDRYNSILDFVFVSQELSDKTHQAEIIVEAGDCPDDNREPDHRPVRASVSL